VGGLDQAPLAAVAEAYPAHLGPGAARRGPGVAPAAQNGEAAETLAGEVPERRHDRQTTPTPARRQPPNAAGG